MATIGGMFVNIGADTSALERDFGRAQKVIADAATRMERTAQRIGDGFSAMGRKAAEAAKSFASFGTALSVARGLGQLVGQTLDAADAIAKIAREIGISTTALQEWRFVALRAGVSAETMDNVLRSLSTRLRSMSEDGGKLRAELKGIGVEFRNADGSAQNVGDVFGKLVQSTGKAGTAIERSANSMKLFGSAAADMAKVADLGSERIAEFRRQANELGIVIDEKLIQSAESAKDKFNILSTVLKTRVTAAVAELAPKIDELARFLIAALPQINAFIRQTAQFLGFIDLSALERIAEIRKELATLKPVSGVSDFMLTDTGLEQDFQEAIKLREEMRRLQAGLLARSFLNNPPAASAPPLEPGPSGVDTEAVEKRAAALEKMASALNPVVEAQAKFDNFIATMGPLLDEDAQLAGAYFDVLGKLKENLRHARIEARDTNATVNASIDIWEGAADAARMFADADKAAATALDDFKTGLEQQNEALRLTLAGQEEMIPALQFEIELRERLKTLAPEQADELRALFAVYQDLTGQIERQAEATKKAEAAAQEWQRIWTRAAEGIQDALAGAFRSALDGSLNSFRDFADRIKNLMFDVAAQIAAALVFRPVIGSIVGSLGLSAAGAAGSASGAGNILGNSFSALGSLLGLGGGTVASGGGFAGFALGGAATGLAALGPILPAVAAIAAAGTLAFSLFGNKKPSVGPNQSTFLAVGAAGNIVPAGGSADNGGTIATATAQALEIANSFGELIEAIGGTFENFRDFGRRAVASFKDIAAQIAAALVFRPVASPA